MKKTKRIIAVFLALVMLLSTGIIAVTAEEKAKVAVTITTDKKEYSIIDTPYVTVKVTNTSGKKLTGVTLVAEADNWALDTKEETNILEIGEMEAGEIRELGFNATAKCGKDTALAFATEYMQNFMNLFNYPKMFDSYNFIFDSLHYLIHRTFNSRGAFVAYSDESKDCVEETAEVTQSSATVKITAKAWFDKVVEEEKYEPVYNEGKLVIGSYPQSEVKDEALLASLNAQTLNWQSYGYFVGTGSADGASTPDDFMKYADIVYNGAKYRAVTFESYRMVSTYVPSLTETSMFYRSQQYNNGYRINTVYWFKYEPLEWRVLDKDAGLVMTESIIDSQAFSNEYTELLQETELNYYNYDGKYANDWATSSIREWLNEDFYNTAFTDVEKNAIADTTHENKSTGSLDGYSYYDVYNQPDTTDKVFLLSYADVRNSAYGFSTDKNACDSARFGWGTDYAKCQGLNIGSWSGYDFDGASYWLLRSPSFDSGRTGYVYSMGTCSGEYSDCQTDSGIRPAITVPCISE